MVAVNKMEKVEKRWSVRHRVTSSYSPALSELYSESPGTCPSYLWLRYLWRAIFSSSLQAQL